MKEKKLVKEIIVVSCGPAQVRLGANLPFVFDYSQWPQNVTLSLNFDRLLRPFELL